MRGGLRARAPAVGEPRSRSRTRRSGGRRQTVPPANPPERIAAAPAENPRRAAGLQQQLRGGRPADAHQYGIALDPSRTSRGCVHAAGVIDRCHGSAHTAAVRAGECFVGRVSPRGSACRALRTPPRPRRARRPGPARSPRRSTMAAMCTPRACRSRDRPRRPPDWRRPSPDDVRGRRRGARASRHAPEASITPGRSLLRNTAGCSITPVANTTAWRASWSCACGSASATH